MPTQQINLNEVITNVYSNIVDNLTPRRYDAAPGFSHVNTFVNHTACTIASMFGQIINGMGIDKGQVNTMSAVTKLTTCGMPYYAVADSFLRVVAATDIPNDMQFGEVVWPFDAVTFCLPVKFVKQYVGYDVDIPFVSGACFAHKEMIDTAKVWPKLPQSIMPMIEVPYPRVVIFFADMKDAKARPDIQASYGSSYRMSDTMATMEDGHYNIWSELDGPVPTLNLPHDEEVEVNRKLCQLFVKLLIILACDEPRYIEQSKLLRAASTPGQKHYRGAIWSMPFIGRSHVIRPHDIQNDHTDQSQVSRRHLRRRHIVRQAIGPRDQVVAVASLPRTADGKTDWDAVTDELKARFWASHKSLWIEPIVVKSNEKSTR